MTSASERHAAPDERVPWTQLIAYGMGGMVPIALFNIAGQLMGLLGNISLGLSAFWLGTIMIVPRLWDAISDPIVGHWSDNTRSKYGRRRPFILVGGIAVALSFVLMWWVPRGEAIQGWFNSGNAYNWFQLIYILAGLLVFYTACTVFAIPHGALGMEMSNDYHERTRLFSAQSFFGNLFAMGTPWLIAVANLEFFRGAGGDLIDGMRYVSLFIAAVLIPLVLWWFVVLREPGFAAAQKQAKGSFWQNMSTAFSNKTFLCLILIIFTLAMGFNFVSLFNYYITIFYLYGGSEDAASTLLGINGTFWAVTGLLAVFPLNVLSRAMGKSKTLLVSIVLMCLAQLSKIVCYDPDHPFLIIVPTVLLSSGMLMFFTLGSSMVGDICDEDELRLGKRNEGSYYSVYWWFIKMGTAFASFVTGVLLTQTYFDETQNASVNSLRGNLAVVAEKAEAWERENVSIHDRKQLLQEKLKPILLSTQELEQHFLDRKQQIPNLAEHAELLAEQARLLSEQAKLLEQQAEMLLESPQELVSTVAKLKEDALGLKLQAPDTLFRLRLVEIGLPLLLSLVSIALTLKYPLTEERCYEIKAALKARKAATGDPAARASQENQPDE